MSKNLLSISILSALLSTTALADATRGENLYLHGKDGQDACVKCHLRSGNGMAEGNIVTLPINTNVLLHEFKGDLTVGREGAESSQVAVAVNRYLHALYKGVPHRDGYSTETFHRAITAGKDASGRKLADVMPRFHYSAAEASDILAYLNKVTNERVVGVDDTTMRIATIVTPDVAKVEVDSLVAGLNQFIHLHNVQGQRVIRDFRKLDLQVWTLTGPSTTWGSQLAAKFKAQPVALIAGGISNESWKPIYDFTEANHIPTILPITDRPVISADKLSWTYFWTKGQYGEGVAAAKWVEANIPADKKVVQVMTKDASAFSNGFYDELNSVGRVKQAQTMVGDQDQKAIEGADVVVIWGDMTVISKFNTTKPTIISATLVGSALPTVDQDKRANTFITYPYWLPQDPNAVFKYRIPHFGEVPGIMAPIAITDNKVAYKTNTLVHVLGDLLTSVRGDFRATNIIDRIGKVMVGPPMGISDDSPYDHIAFSPVNHFIGSNPKIVQLDEKGKLTVVE